MPRAAAAPTNPALLAAMKRALESETGAAEPELVRALESSTPIVAITRNDDVGEEVIGVAVDGALAVPAFTDLDALLRWDPEARDWAAMTGPALCGLAVEQGAARVLLNPAGPYGGSLREPDLSMIADSAALENRDRDPGVLSVKTGGVQLTAANGAAPALEAMLRTALQETTGIAGAHLLVARYPERKQWLLAVLLAGTEDPKQVMGSLRAALARALSPGTSIDVIVADDALRAALSEFEPLWLADGDITRSDR